uniref:hypothetical protein n=1 Tax=Agathobacter sp. TaxID=2021311 RepID=UPI0040575526
MKKRKLRIFALVVALATMMAGCGTQVFELTESEEKLIIHSAAHIVAKHNIQQKDGVINVIITEGEEKLEEIEGTQEPEPTETEEPSQTEQNESGEASSEAEHTMETVSMAAAIGHGSDLSVSYKGSTVSKHYTEGAYYSIDAGAGKTYYIMKFDMKNISDAEATVDNVSLNAVFKLNSGDLKVQAEVTFLNTDLSTYLGNIAPGAAAEAILLFEVPESAAESITAPKLQVTVGGDTKLVEF